MKHKHGFSRKMLSVLLSLLMVSTMLLGTSLSAAAAESDIVILYTNDVHCAVDDNIGYAGLSLYKKQMQAQTPYVALVDAGDAIQGASIGTLSDGGYLIDIMNQVGYDFAIPGNHEFDYGMPRLMDLAGKLNCGYYSCNFTDNQTGAPAFQPYKLMTFGDTTVALIGASTPESFTKSTPAYFQDANGNYLYNFCEDETGAALYARIQQTVDSARAAGADFVIVVGHLGENGVTSRWSSDTVIANTNGINVFIDGHSHETVNTKTVKNKDGQDVTITQTGTKLKNIGKLTIKPDKTFTTELVSEVTGSAATLYTVQKNDSLSRIAKRELGSYNLWDVIYNANRDKISNPNVIPVGLVISIPSTTANADGKAADATTDAFIKNIQAQYAETLKTVLGFTSAELTINNPETGNRAIRSGETNLGDLCADAYRTQLGADIGLTNGGGIRASIKPGNITYNDALTVFPFGNMGTMVEATGQQIKDALEMSARLYPAESGGFLQVSGMTYTVNSSTPSGVKIDDKGNFVKVDGAYRVSDIMVNGQPLDLAKTYTVASHNYLLREGGDGMSMFKGCNVLRDNTAVDVDLLSTYLHTLGADAASVYSNPAGEGRITIK